MNTKTIIIIITSIIMTTAIILIINPFKSKKSSSTGRIRGEGGGEGGGGEGEGGGEGGGGVVEVPGDVRTIDDEPELETWDEIPREELPSIENYLTGDRSSKYNQQSSNYYYVDGGVVATTTGDIITTQSNLQRQGCYITKDYVNDYDIYKLHENAPILSHFYEEQLAVQTEIDNNSVPTTKDRDYVFAQTGSPNYEKDVMAIKNPLLCLNVNPKDSTKCVDDRVKWDQKVNYTSSPGIGTSNIDSSIQNERIRTGFYISYVGDDIYRSKEDISQGKGVCQKWNADTQEYEGTLCNHVIGKILENMMVQQEMVINDNTPSCIIDKKTVQKWRSTGQNEKLPVEAAKQQAVSGNRNENNYNNEKIFQTFDVTSNKPHYHFDTRPYTAYVEQSGLGNASRIVQLYGKENNVYQPYTYEKSVDDSDTNKDNEILTLVYSKTGTQEFNPKIEGIKDKASYIDGFHLTDVGYEITNTEQVSNEGFTTTPTATSTNPGAGHLTAFNPRPDGDGTDDFTIGDLSGKSFPLVNKSFGEFSTTSDAKQVESVNWYKIPTYMGKPIIYGSEKMSQSSDPAGASSIRQGDSRHMKFIVHPGADENTDQDVPALNDNFTYKKRVEPLQNINPLQNLGKQNDTKIYCEIDVDFKNNRLDSVETTDIEDLPKAIKQYCYMNDEAQSNMKAFLYTPDASELTLTSKTYLRELGVHWDDVNGKATNPIYPIHGVEFCHIESGCQGSTSLKTDATKFKEWRHNNIQLKDYWDGVCSRYMERYPFTGFNYSDDFYTRYGKTRNVANLSHRHSQIRTYKIKIKKEVTSTEQASNPIPIYISEVSFGDPIAMPFRIEPFFTERIEKVVENLESGQYRVTFKKYKTKHQDSNKQDRENFQSLSYEEQVNLVNSTDDNFDHTSAKQEYLKHLYYSIKQESYISSKDKNTNDFELLKFPKNHMHHERIFKNLNTESPHQNSNKDDDGVFVGKGEICINDIIGENALDLDYKIFENKLIKYLFPIGNRVSVRKYPNADENGVGTSIAPQLPDTIYESPGYYMVGIVNDNKGNNDGDLTIQLNNIRGQTDQTAKTKTNIDINLVKDTELFVTKGIFTFPEPVNKSICDTFKLSYSRSNEAHNLEHETTFGTSDLYEYHSADIGSEDLIKDLYFTSSHFDEKACFAVGEIFNQGRYGNDDIDKDNPDYIPRLKHTTADEDLDKKITPGHAREEVRRQQFSTEPNLNKYTGLYNLEKSGKEISSTTYGSAICGITNNDSSYYLSNEKLRNYMKNAAGHMRKRGCGVWTQAGLDADTPGPDIEFKKKQGCSVLDEIGYPIRGWTENVNGIITVDKSRLRNNSSGNWQKSTMPFKEGLVFKHDINDIKHRYKTHFIRGTGAGQGGWNDDKYDNLDISKLLKYNHEIKNKYWGNITQRQRNMRDEEETKTRKIHILFFIIPAIIILIILYFIFKK